LGGERRGGKHRADYSDAVTESTDPDDDSAERTLETADSDADGDGAKPAEPKRKRGALREGAILVTIAVVLYYVMLTFVARPYLIPSESMEPTLHGCTGCTGDRIMVDKLTYRFSSPQPGDVIVFKGPPNWNIGYKSIRSHNTAVRWLQNALSFIGFVPPDENDLVKRVIAVGGQTVECRANTGLTVDGKRLKEPYLDPTTMMADPKVYPCLGNEFGPVKVPEGRLWVMGDNRTHSADSRAHCGNAPADAQRGLLCTGDPMAGTIPIDNVIGRAIFIAWPPSRWGGVGAVNPQTQ
jgi:signal peptidase I